MPTQPNPQSQTTPRSQPVLLLHGGAWAMPDDAIADHEHGIRTALEAGWALLKRGASALDAVEASIASMEDDPTFDAGRGSFLTRDGRVQMDALLMSGHDLRAGGVACVERLQNPIRAARLILDQSPHIYFVGIGAERFASQHGMPLVENSTLITPRERDRLMHFQRAELAGEPDTTFSGSTPFSRTLTEAATGRRFTGPDPAPNDPAPNDPDPALAEAALTAEVTEALPAAARLFDPTLDSHDTVGAVALDLAGNLAAGTSTGGTLSKAPGRVGDSSLIGCGCYADNQSAAVSLTGWGEPIMKLVLGKWAADRVAAGTPPAQAATDSIGYLFRRLGGHGGIILLGPDGSLGLAHNTPRMAWGLATPAGLSLGITRNP